MRKFWICGMSMVLSALLIVPSYAGEWIRDANRPANDNGLSNWWYRNDDGTYPANGWFWIDSDGDGLAESFRFDAAGWMYADTVVDDYTVDASGMWTVDGVVQRTRVGGRENSLESSGNGDSSGGEDSSGSGNRSGGSGSSDGSLSSDDSSGSSSFGSGSSEKENPRNEWHIDGNGRQYYDSEGELTTGWKKISGKMYYFDEDGYVLTGYQEVDGLHYYFYSDGERAENTVHSRGDGVYYVVVKREFYVQDVVAEAEWEDYKRNADQDTVEVTKVTNENKAGDETTADIALAEDGINDEMAMECFDLINEERIKAGVEPLVYNEDVMEACRLRAQELSERFSHTRPDNSACFTVFDEVGLSYYEAGENIAAGMKTPSGAVEAWMNSSGHKRNILTEEYTDSAVGCYIESGTQYKVYWVQMFCNPR